MKKQNVSTLVVLMLTAAIVCFMGGCEPKKGAPVSSEPKLFVSLDQTCDTPDGMTMAPDGNIILACPNYADQNLQGCLLKIDSDMKIKKWIDVPVHPMTGLA